MPKQNADLAMDAAACIGCGACVAACPNASAMLFVAAKVSHLALLPQGQPERYTRARAMVDRWTRKASATAPTTANARPPAPRASRLENIARMNRDFLKASLTFRPETGGAEGRRRLPKDCSQWIRSLQASEEKHRIIMILPIPG